MRAGLVASSARDRLVAYSRERREYLAYDCLGSTRDRAWAWSGTIRQARNMVRVYPASRDYEIFYDGEEHMGESVHVR